jgi:hypothetical protein
VKWVWMRKAYAEVRGNLSEGVGEDWWAPRSIKRLGIVGMDDVLPRISGMIQILGQSGVL